MKYTVTLLSERQHTDAGLSPIASGTFEEHFFYWICDCSAVKEILEYEGSNPQLRRWRQELRALILSSSIGVLA